MSVAGNCLYCGATFTGADQETIAAAFTIHHDRQHKGQTPLFSITRPQDQAVTDAAAATVPGQQWEQIRTVRDTQLIQTDWIIDPPADVDQATRDLILANQPGWNNFRRALRALTNQTSDPTKVVWPTPPPQPPCRLAPPPIFTEAT